MEAIGLSVGIVGLAGLFSSCLDIASRVKDYRSSGTDMRALDAQFEADRHRLEQWGGDVGFERGRLSDSHHELLDNDKIVLLVTELLHVIYEVCSSASLLEPGHQSLGKKASSSVHSPGMHGPIGGSRRRKLTWALGGKGERSSQVTFFGTLVTKLYEVVPPGTARYGLSAQDADGAAWTGGRLTQAALHSNDGWLVEIQQVLANRQGEVEITVTPCIIQKLILL